MTITLGSALQGLRVLDFSQIGAGPTIGMLMGDMGADVIKVEPPSGDLGRQLGPPWLGGEAVVGLSFNRNKRGLGLDLKRPSAVRAVHRLAARADVVIESFRPGVMDRLGVGYKALAAENPALVYCAVSAFGQDGPWADRPGVDGIVQALSGLISQIGLDGAEPSKIQVPAVDMTTGFLGTVAVLAALRARDATGKGQFLDISMYNASLMLQQTGLAAYFATGEVPARIGSAAPYAAPNEAYRTADGWMMVAAYHPKRWQALCELLAMDPGMVVDPRFATIDARVRNRAELRELLEAGFRTRKTTEWLPLLEARDIMCAPVADYAMVTGSEQFRHARAAITIQHATAGEVRMPGFLLGDRDTQAKARLAPPDIGEHSREILAEYGFEDVEIEGLVSDGAVLAGRRAGK
jgi:crotonobetainyl-CoA:carnitine CoA-transferase CaiB-like acyl-CoA transferase